MDARVLLLTVLTALAPIAGAQDADAPPETTATEADGVTDETRAAEDAAVEQVLEDAELIYGEDEESDDFVPSQEVSADQLLDYPVDI